MNMGEKFIGSLILIFFMYCVYALSTTFGEKDLYWYPITLVNADCPMGSGQYYIMKHSTGWRSWPYVLDPEDMKETQLPYETCVFKTVKKFSKVNSRVSLTSEQSKFLVEGF